MENIGCPDTSVQFQRLRKWHKASVEGLVGMMNLSVPLIDQPPNHILQPVNIEPGYG